MKKVVGSKVFDILSYLLLTGVLVAGFAAYQKYKWDPVTQFWAVMAGVCAYLGWGLVYHHLRRDMALRVYLEYLLIASIVLVASVVVFLR